MRRIQRLALVIVTATAVVLGTAGVASAEPQAVVEYDNQFCEGSGVETTTIDLFVTITNDAAEDTFDIVISGVTGLDPDPSLVGASGGSHEFNLSGLGDGLLTVVVTHAVTDVEYARWELVLGCNGPTVLAEAVCVDGEGFILVAPFYDGKESFDIAIDELLVGDAVSAFTSLDHYTYGPYAAGPHTVDVMIVDSDAEPWAFNIEVADCSDAGSGAGIPTVGSNTSPLVATAGALILLGGALVLVRRTRTA